MSSSIFIFDSCFYTHNLEGLMNGLRFETFIVNRVSTYNIVEYSWVTSYLLLSLFPLFIILFSGSADLFQWKQNRCFASVVVFLSSSFVKCFSP